LVNYRLIIKSSPIIIIVNSNKLFLFVLLYLQYLDSYEAAAAKEISLFISSGAESQSDSDTENKEVQEDDYNASSYYFIKLILKVPYK